MDVVVEVIVVVEMVAWGTWRVRAVIHSSVADVLVIRVDTRAAQEARCRKQCDVDVRGNIMFFQFDAVLLNGNFFTLMNIDALGQLTMNHGP